MGLTGPDGKPQGNRALQRVSPGGSTFGCVCVQDRGGVPEGAGARGLHDARLREVQWQQTLHRVEEVTSELGPEA